MIGGVAVPPSVSGPMEPGLNAVQAAALAVVHFGATTIVEEDHAAYETTNTAPALCAVVMSLAKVPGEPVKENARD